MNARGEQSRWITHSYRCWVFGSLHDGGTCAWLWGRGLGFLGRLCNVCWTGVFVCQQAAHMNMHCRCDAFCLIFTKAYILPFFADLVNGPNCCACSTILKQYRYNVSSQQASGPSSYKYVLLVYCYAFRCAPPPLYIFVYREAPSPDLECTI